MASSNYIQKIFAADEVGSSNDLGQDSTTDSRRNQVEIAIVGFSGSASTTLTLAAGDVVCWDFTDGGDGKVCEAVKKSAASGAATGVCITGGTSKTDGSGDPLTSSKIEVCIGGLCEAKVKGENAAGAASISSGDYLAQSDAAGVLYKFTAGTDAVPVAIAVDDVASAAVAANKTVIWLKQW